jgi:hypothetical protein
MSTRPQVVAGVVLVVILVIIVIQGKSILSTNINLSPNAFYIP